jgi:mRNA interferase MazF
LVRLDKSRPCLVVSNDSLNSHALDVCVVPITSVFHRGFSLRVSIQAGDGGLARDSWAKCDQVATVNKQVVLYPPLGKLSAAALRGIEDGIRSALELL